jgi:hypothetical protein
MLNNIGSSLPNNPGDCGLIGVAKNVNQCGRI